MAKSPPRQPLPPPQDLGGDDENMLERALRKSPDFLRDYGTYLLLGLCVLAAGWWYYNTRANAEAVRSQNTAQGLSNLARTVSSADAAKRTAAFQTPDNLARQQSELTSEFDANAAAVSGEGNAGAKSAVLRLRGDFAWAMATLPTPLADSPASTQPSTQPVPTTRPASEWLADAQSAYTQVVEQYPKQTADNLAALFGLAAVAEQEGRFDEAGKFYDQLLARDDLGEGTKAIARQRKALLPMLGQNPRLIAAAPPPPTSQPASQPAMSLDDLRNLLPPPATRPATEPADAPEPATRPAE